MEREMATEFGMIMNRNLQQGLGNKIIYNKACLFKKINTYILVNYKI